MMWTLEAFGAGLAVVAAGMAVASLGPKLLTELESLVAATRPRRATPALIPVQVRHPHR